MPIVDQADFIEYVGSEIYANQPWLAASLNAAEYAIKHHCHRDFTVAGATATVRVFRPPVYCDVLYVDDFSTDVGLVVADNAVTVADADYELEPLNGLDETGSTVPYTAIRRVAGSWYWNGNRASVSVTAKWGWVAVPADVVEACVVLAKDLAALRDARFGVAGFGEFGVVRMRENPQVLSLLAPHVRHDRVGV